MINIREKWNNASKIFKTWVLAFTAAQICMFMLGFAAMRSFWSPEPMLYMCGLFIVFFIVSKIFELWDD